MNAVNESDEGLKAKLNLWLNAFNSSQLVRWTIKLSLVVVGLWTISLCVLNAGVPEYLWFVNDVETQRTLLSGIFQGLAGFFAIVISVTLLVAQLVYGSFSPRLMPRFLKNRAFLTMTFLFLIALSFNLILLTELSAQTIAILIPLIILDVLISLAALILVVPMSLVLLRSAHPMNIGLELVERFDHEYFKKIPFDGPNSTTDGDLPLLQSLVVKSLRDADTDYARRLLGSFEQKLVEHLSDTNAVTYAAYFNGFFKKIAFVAAEENEEDVLQQLAFANEALEKKVSNSKRYMSDYETRSQASFAGNILYIITLAIRKGYDQVLGRAQGSMYRLRELFVQSIPADNEISTFRFIKNIRSGVVEERTNENEHYLNETVFEYVSKLYFQSISSVALEALRLNNSEAAQKLIRDIFHATHSLRKMSLATHQEVVRRIAFGEFYSLSRICQLSINSNTNFSGEIAKGIEDHYEFFLQVDEKLAESYIDLLGQLMIETTEREVPNSDPTSTFFWAGVVLRMSLSPRPLHISLKLLGYFEKVLLIIKDRQTNSSSPTLEKIKETICQEIVSMRNYKESDPAALAKAEEILAQYPEVKLKT